MTRASAWASVGAVVLALAGTASASAESCAVLSARLASLDRGAEDFWNDNLSGTDAAIERKRAELAQAVAAARRAGCRGGLLFDDAASSTQCGALTAHVEQIDIDLRRLEAQRQTFAGDPYAAERQRSQIIREMVSKGCSDRNAGRQAGNRRRTGLFSSLFGGRRVFRETRRSEGYDAGTYRTMCVRTCDGYYFPISFQASPAAFSRDENACRARCPGTDVGLYVHRNPGEGAEQMVSLAGEPYVALPNAFRFRREYDRACACPSVAAGEATWASAVDDPPATTLSLEAAGSVLTLTDTPGAAIAVVPEPTPRAAHLGDPETTANRAGRFAPRAAPPDREAGAPLTSDRGGSPVRVVGPTGPYTVR